MGPVAWVAVRCGCVWHSSSVPALVAHAHQAGRFSQALTWPSRLNVVGPMIVAQRVTISARVADSAFLAFCGGRPWRICVAIVLCYDSVAIGILLMAVCWAARRDYEIAAGFVVKRLVRQR